MPRRRRPPRRSTTAPGSAKTRPARVMMRATRSPSPTWSTASWPRRSLRRLSRGRRGSTASISGITLKVTSRAGLRPSAGTTETLTLAETEGLPYTITTAAAATRIKKIEALAADPRGDAAVRAVARETLAKLKAGKRSKHAPGPDARHIVSPHATGAIRLLLLSGCRLSEILNLRWTDVDIDRGLLMLPDSKTGPRPVWLNAAALAVLESLSGIRVSDYVIAGDRPDVPRADLNRPWRQIVKHAELDGVTLHTLRHTHASIGVGAGIGLPLVGALLGHRVSSTTQRYAHIANDPARRASETIGTTMAAALERRPLANVVGGGHRRS
jgi:integrase